MRCSVSDIPWQKSSFSNEQIECVEVGRSPGVLLLRESDDPGTVIRTTPTALAALLRAAKADRIGETQL